MGRMLCVALPYLLTAGSLVLLLAACFGSVTTEDLYVVRINTTDSTADKIDRVARDEAGNVSNISLSFLAPNSIYDITIWSYCVSSGGERACTKPSFDWASGWSSTASFPIDAKELDYFRKALLCTQISYAITGVGLALSLCFGVFANYTRIMSCVTFLVAQGVSVAIAASVSLSTAVAVIIVATFDGSAERLGATASLNPTFLVMCWTSLACALGAGFFWMFTICCRLPAFSFRDSQDSLRD